MKSSIIKRSIAVAGHKTSISLEDAFWEDLRDIAADCGMTPSDLVGKIDSERQYGNLSSAIRLFVLGFYRRQISKYEKRGRTRKQRHRPDGTKAKAIALGHLEKFLSPSLRESDSVTARGHGRMERANHGAEGLFRC